jgi:Tol biopolymer transport system component
MVTEDDGERYLSSELVAVRSDGSARVQLTDTPDRQEMNPSWSPDGTRLAFDDILDGVVYVLPIAE